MDTNYERPNAKRGYLKGDFELFHLSDRKNLQFEYHYHEFYKILIFISGKVTYLIEGKAYKLKPWDILLVNNNEVHKPVIDPEETYDRIVIWVNPEFLTKHSSEECDLSACFAHAYEAKYNLIRLNHESLTNIKRTLSQLEEACKSNEFGSRILKNSLFMQLAVSLNREFIKGRKARNINDVEFDESINMVIDYVNENIGKDLSIDTLSSIFYMSKYYLMHKFKVQTGYSIHNYILQKRLITANTLVRQGKPAAEVSAECGFGDYSNFVRSFKKAYGLSPRNYYKDVKPETDSINKKHFQ